MQWIACGEPQIEEIRSLFNEAILHTTALWEDEPRPAEAVRSWLESKRQQGLPVTGLLDAHHALAGFGTYGPFRPHYGFRRTAEHSIYVAPAHRGKGIGRLLLQRLMAQAQEAGIHVLIGAIDAGNAASIALHRSLGFEECGHFREVGFKFDRWQDALFFQKILAKN